MIDTPPRSRHGPRPRRPPPPRRLRPVGLWALARQDFLVVTGKPGGGLYEIS